VAFPFFGFQPTARHTLEIKKRKQSVAEITDGDKMDCKFLIRRGLKAKRRQESTYGGRKNVVMHQPPMLN
jgi:hypothetical protein